MQHGVLRRFVTAVVEMWECEWKKLKQNYEVTNCLKTTFPYSGIKWKMTQDEILSDLYTGCLFCRM